MFLSYYYFEYYIFMIPAIALVFAAQIIVQSRYKKYSSVGNSRSMTGAQMAEYLLKQNSVTDVAITLTGGQMSDHFDPRSKTIALSQEVFNGTSVAAVCIAAHEAGHAVQHATGYFPLRIRSFIIPISNVGSRISIPLIIIGGLLDFPVLVNVAIIFFALSAFLQFITLPVEFNASRRAISVISGSGIFSEADVNGSRKMLSAAAMTYVAAFAQSLLSLLYHVLRFTNNRRR